MNCIPRPVLAPEELRPETRLIHSGILRSQYGENAEALYLTQGFVYDEAETAEARFSGKEPGFVYSRYANPTLAMFEQRMAAVEGRRGLPRHGDRHGGGHFFPPLFPEGGRSCRRSTRAVRIVPLGDRGFSAALRRTLHPRRRHRPRSNGKRRSGRKRAPSFWRARPIRRSTCSTSQRSRNSRNRRSAKLIVDNVFATPMLQSPLKLGADIVVYSATKHIDGQGRCLGGVVLSSEQFIMDHLHNFMRQTGPSLVAVQRVGAAEGTGDAGNPRRAHAGERGEDRRSAREHKGNQEGALSRPADHPQAALAKKQMKGGGTLVSFEVEGGKAGAFRFSNALRLIRISNNLGDAKSLIVHPATTTHQRFTPEARAEMGIGDGLLRFSVGLEHPDDLADDLARGLKAI